MQQLTMFEYWSSEDQQQHDDHVGKSVLDMVKEFRESAGQTFDEQMAASLIEEEFSEWLNVSCSEYNLEEELKELADLVYVIFGYASGKGWNLDEAVRRVHENNMGRMIQDDGTIQRRADGKIMKNPNYPQVKLDDLV